LGFPLTLLVNGFGFYPNPNKTKGSSSNLLLPPPLASRPVQLAGGRRSPPAAAVVPTERGHREGEEEREKSNHIPHGEDE